jgi:hypothetical protein
MALQTRGSAELDKAERRLAGLKSIDANLDLGFGLTVETYTQLIESIRQELAQHNQMVADIHASRKNLDDSDRQLATMSAQILSIVKVKYGGTSAEYGKVGGTVSKNNATNTSKDTSKNVSDNAVDSSVRSISDPEVTQNGNGQVKEVVLK